MISVYVHVWCLGTYPMLFINIWLLGPDGYWWLDLSWWRWRGFPMQDILAINHWFWRWACLRIMTMVFCICFFQKWNLRNSWLIATLLAIFMSWFYCLGCLVQMLILRYGIDNLGHFMVEDAIECDFCPVLEHSLLEQFVLS